MLVYIFWYKKNLWVKKVGQLLLWIWIKKLNEWWDKESYHYWIFCIGPDYFFTKNRYSWFSHANLAIWWWSPSKISSSIYSWSALVFAYHVMILSWRTTTPEFFFSCLVIIIKNLLMIYWLYLIRFDLNNWKHCDVADCNRFWFSPYFLKYQFCHLENITFL